VGGILEMTKDEIQAKISQVDLDLEKIKDLENSDKKGEMLRQYRDFLLEQLNQTLDE
jgi:hypothetical protein